MIDTLISRGQPLTPNLFSSEPSSDETQRIRKIKVTIDRKDNGVENEASN